MKIIKIEKCNKKCPYNNTYWCIKVIVKGKLTGINMHKRFTRIERGGRRDFPKWCPLEDCEYRGGSRLPVEHLG